MTRDRVEGLTAGTVGSQKNFVRKSVTSFSNPIFDQVKNAVVFIVHKTISTESDREREGE